MMKKVIRVVSLVLFSAFIISCATGRSMDFPEKPVVIRGVPFFSQEDYQCGPAALATVMNYWHIRTGKDIRTTPEEIGARIYSPSARGVLGIDLERYARKAGFHTEQSRGGLRQLRNLVDLDMPVIIFVDYGFLFYAVHHFMVVTGYRAGEIIVNSGKNERESLSAATLDRIWKRNNYWMLVLKPQS